MDTMKRLSFLLSIVLLLFAKQSVEAASNVKVTTNNNGTTETHVRIETNGEVKSFDTKGDEDVDWTSGDGQSSVKINSNTKNPTPTPTKSESKTSIGVSQDTDSDTDDKATPTATMDDKKTQDIKPFSFSDLLDHIFAFFGFKKR